MQYAIYEDTENELDKQRRILDEKISLSQEELGEALWNLGKFLGVDLNNKDIKELALKNHFLRTKFEC